MLGVEFPDTCCLSVNIMILRYFWKNERHMIEFCYEHWISLQGIESLHYKNTQCMKGSILIIINQLNLHLNWLEPIFWRWYWYMRRRNLLFVFCCFSGDPQKVISVGFLDLALHKLWKFQRRECMLLLLKRIKKKWKKMLSTWIMF